MDFISREISGNVKFWEQLYFSEQVPELLSRAKCVEAEESFCQNFGKSSQKVAKTGRKSKKVKDSKSQYVYPFLGKVPFGDASYLTNDNACI